MCTLFFIRHAESEANRQRIFASRQAFPLTQAGHEDSQRIATELKNITELDGIITSPLLRAQQTSDAFAKVFNLTPVMDERLAEQELGPFSGKSYDEAKTMDGYVSDPLARWNWRPGNSGESYAMVADRILHFLDSASQFADGTRWLVVTHAVVFRMLQGALKNTLPQYPIQFPNNGEIWKVLFQSLGQVHDIESIFLGKSQEFVHNA